MINTFRGREYALHHYCWPSMYAPLLLTVIVDRHYLPSLFTFSTYRLTVISFVGVKEILRLYGCCVCSVCSVLVCVQL